MLIAQLIIDGLGKGVIYAGIALAIVVVHRSTGLVNFAQGEFATLSVVLAATLTAFGLNIWAALAVTVIVSFVGAAAVEHFLVRRVMSKSPLASITLLIGLFVCANAVAQLLLGSEPRPMPALFPAGQLDLGIVRIRWALIGVILLQAAVVGGLALLFEKTKVGLAFRAVAAAPDESRIAGLPVERVWMLGWGLAAAVGAVAGVSLTNLGVYLEASMMQSVLIFSLGAITIGGFNSGVGAVLGGILMGVADALITTLVPGVSGEAGLVVSLVVIVGVLLIRPQGLFGRERVQRA